MELELEAVGAPRSVQNDDRGSSISVTVDGYGEQQQG